jgi:hypothetical protein
MLLASVSMETRFHRNCRRCDFTLNGNEIRQSATFVHCILFDGLTCGSFEHHAMWCLLVLVSPRRSLSAIMTFRPAKRGRGRARAAGTTGVDKPTPAERQLSR